MAGGEIERPQYFLIGELIGTPQVDAVEATVLYQYRLYLSGELLIDAEQILRIWTGAGAASSRLDTKQVVQQRRSKVVM